MPAFLFSNHLINHSPIRQSAKVKIIYEQFCIDFRITTAILQHFLGEILVHGIKLHATLPTPLHRLIKEFSTAYSPKNQPMLLLGKHAECRCCKRQFISNFGIFMLNNCPVKIYSNNHNP